jgi:hypothetical protein
MKRISRTQAICQLRDALRPMVDSQTSLCAAVARRGVFCGGFDQWSLAELRARYPWIAERHPRASRRQLVELADRWQRNRTGVDHGRLPCDVPERHRGAAPCAGWEEFYEAELARFVGELCGERVQVVPDELALAR